MIDELDQQLQDKKDSRSFLIGMPIILILIGCAIFLFSPTQKPLFNWGQYIGGIVGTIFSLAGIFLLFLTLLEQRRAFKKERFENRFFELIRLHRSNVKEFNIGDRVMGRKCFNQIVNEFKHIYKLTQVGRDFPEYENVFMNEEDVVDFAFKVLFFGIGYSSERQLRAFITAEEKILFDQFLKPKLTDIQEAYSKQTRIDKENSFEWWLPLSGKKDEWTFEIKYFPFDGHSSRLGHYYRHLFQSVKYVVSYRNEFEYQEIYSYLKLLRAQLSNQEQLLLYYNSLCDFGKKWHEFDFFTTYCFLKNLPIELVDVLPTPHQKIGTTNKYGDNIFEWDNI